jgi:predicted amidohydrolase
MSSNFCYEPSSFVSAYEKLRGEIQRSSIEITSPESRDKVFSRDNDGNKIVVSAVQMETASSTGDDGSTPAQDFLDRALDAVERAVINENSNLVLLQELFMGPYFCQSQEANLFALAESDIEENNAFISMMQKVAKKFHVVLPISVFEQKNNTFYNSVVMIDADGEILGTYSKYKPAVASTI